MINATIIADSISRYTRRRITSFILEYPRFIHSELMTHRMLSRNAASSRAIPHSKFIQHVLDNPALPEKWGSHQKGMQSGKPLDEPTTKEAVKLWMEARNHAIEYAKKLDKLGVHKSISNRILEPWFHIKIVMTATDLTNFFALRAHKDAQPEFEILARQMLLKYNESKPKELEVNEWHIPFLFENEQDLELDKKLIISVARCARTSYMNFEGNNSFEKDEELYESLISSGHFSPTEHQAMCMDTMEYYGNFQGWKQLRKELPDENRTDYRVFSK